MTKLIKGGKIQPFITGDDVIITKGIKHPGKTIDETIEEVDNTLDEHQNEINRLKSNMKYLYSYGGVGGKGSGGSGGGSDSNPSFFVSLDGHPVQAGTNNVIILSSPGTYTISGNVSNSGGKLFYVKADTISSFETSKILPLSTELNRCSFSKTLNLVKNGGIKIEFYDSEMSILHAIEQTYIVNPHTFTTKFMYEFDNGSGNIIDSEFNPYEYFIGDTTYGNPYIDIAFKIDLPNVSGISVTYSIGDTDIVEDDDEYISGQGTKQFDTTDISLNHFKIHLDKLKRGGIKFTDEDNTGVYNVSTLLKYTVNGEEITDKREFTITLIPNYLYINVRNSQNLLYDSIDELLNDSIQNVPRKNLNSGTYTSFYCKIFEGTIKTDKKKYTLTLKAYDGVLENDSYTFNDLSFEPVTVTGVDEQTEMEKPISVAFGSAGIKKLVFSTIGQKDDVPDSSGEVVKYIYVKQTESNIKWYASDLEQSSFYFRANSGNDSFSANFPQDVFQGNAPLELSESGVPITLTDELWGSPTGSWYTTILSFGMQYSSVNKDEAEILKTFVGNDSVANITLYSSKFFSKNIHIPTESKFNKIANDQYHLIQIVRHRIGYVGNQAQYATYLYVDGKPEANKSTIDTNPLFVGKIVLNNVNVIYNLINLQYVNLPIPEASKENYLSPTNTKTIDEVIYQYYLAYKSIMGAGDVSDSEKVILNNMSSIKFDGENVVIPESFLHSVSSSMPIPTMMMEYTNQDKSKLIEFKNNLFKGYRDGDTISFGKQPINLYWCKPGFDTDIRLVSIPQKTDEHGYTYTGSWAVELQGTSTMKNKIKNFSLILDTSTTSGTKKLLMSPNYDSAHYNTFLPESVWTLKADIADSAHANNTSIGKFVNKNCTHFSESNKMSLPTDIAKYVKNTLEGFPFLMYFKIGAEIYYLGVYNFNMGRSSYYNLGYHTREDMESMISSITETSSFTYAIGSGTVVQELAIGEIQDNNPEFDFHQYDPSVLFSGDVSSNSKATMFGPDSKITGPDIGAAKNTLEKFVQSVAKAGAYCFARIGKRAVSSQGDNGSTSCVNRYNIVPYEDENYNTKYYEEVPDIHYQFKYDGSNRIWDESGPTFSGLKNNVENLLQCISDYDIKEVEQSTYHFLDYTSASEYYTICMAFGMVDSILKNMNIKSWDGKKCYVAFYDMDCALGENNMGVEDVSYLAATDYWHSDTSKGYVEPVTINFDYWDDKIGKGFDFPSSYLFAIAKYAQAILGSYNKTLPNYPQQFWAKLRSTELKDADYFLKNYFSSGIGQIPSYMAALNYQVKYLYYGSYLDANNNEKTDYIANEGAFNGTRIEKVKDWLNKRLHFLDVVFNVQNISIPIGGGYSMPSATTGTLNTLSSNTDVVILSDAFSKDTNANALMSSNDVPVDVWAPINTPFINNRGKAYEIYILGAKTGEPNHIKVNATQSQASRFLGSTEFTKLSRIEPFLTTGNQIVSNNLENIYYSRRDFPTYDIELDVVSTSVKSIDLNIPTLSGKLNIDSGDELNSLNGQALYELNVSNSGLTGSWKGLKNLKKLNISSVNNPSETISVSECPLNGDLCSISGTEENPTTLKKLELLGVYGSYNLEHTHIQEIHFEASSQDRNAEFSIVGDVLLKDLSLSGFKSIVIRECPNLETITINDDKDNPICERIIIDIPETTEQVTTLKKINSDRVGVFDFTKYGNLKLLGISGCEEVQVIKIPNRKVSVETFSNNKNLEFIDTTGVNSKIELIQDGTFYNSPRYGMRQSWWSTQGPDYDISTLVGQPVKLGKYTKICISENCVTLANTFNKMDGGTSSRYSSNPYINDWGIGVLNRSLTMTEAQKFIEDYVGGQPVDDAYIYYDSDNNRYMVHDTQITSVSIGPDCRGRIESLYGCFNEQRGIEFTIWSKGTYPVLSEYTKLNDISLMYYGTGVNFINSNLLSLPYSCNTNDEENQLSWGDFISGMDLRITKDAFKNISYRISGLNSMNLTICDNSSPSTIINTSESDGYLDIVDILCPQEYNPDVDGECETFTRTEDGVEHTYKAFTRIESISIFSVNPNQYVDYRLLFDACPNVTSLEEFLNADLSKSEIGGMLKHCQKLTSIFESFNHNTGNIDNAPEIDLYDFFNWGDEHLFDMYNLFNSSSTTETGFSIKKTISSEHFFEILGSLHNYHNLTALCNLFSYCTIINYDGSEIKLSDDMNDVVSINSLFYKCQSNNGLPLNIKRSFFEHLPNVTSLANTFTGVHFNHMLSYDFFCKQKTYPETVYVKPDGYDTPVYGATLTKIGYNKEHLINNMYNCFLGAKFENCKCWFDVNDGNQSLIPVKDTVTYNGVSYDTYYIMEGGSLVEYTISDPVAYTDTLNNFTNYVSEVHFPSGNNTIIINNHSISSDLAMYHNVSAGVEPFTENQYNIYPTYCCLPPDIFHGCYYECDLTRVFADTNIIGVIPQHLLKNCYNGKLLDMFRNVNILPNLIYHYNKNNASDPGYLSLIENIDVDENIIITETTDDTYVYDLDTTVGAVVLFRDKNGNLKRRHPITLVHVDGDTTPIDDNKGNDYSKSQFVYVPQGYTTNQNLQKVFTFRYNLPQQVNLNVGLLQQEGITDWAAGNYGVTYSPERKPYLWPYHTQYFFMLNESLDWTGLNDMSYPFILDSEDVDFIYNEPRVFSTANQGYHNRWWNRFENIDRSSWYTFTNGIFNVFLNLCGKRNVRTGKVNDCGCMISKSMNRNPQLSKFVSGILVIFLNGKVFDDLDAGRFTTLNGGPIIDYTIGLGRNITFPEINYVTPNINDHPRVLLTHDAEKAYFYEFMFDSNSSTIQNYKNIYGVTPEIIKADLKYKVLL